MGWFLAFFLNRYRTQRREKALRARIAQLEAQLNAIDVKPAPAMVTVPAPIMLPNWRTALAKGILKFVYNVIKLFLVVSGVVFLIFIAIAILSHK